MSKVLIIRHLPEALSFDDKEQLLKHFGAQNVWETPKKRNYLFASFASVEQAKTSLGRLHQLEIAQRRLVVEFSEDKEPIRRNNKNTEEISVITKHLKDFLRHLNAWNPSIDFYQPPPIHLKYKYPELSSQVAINIISAMYKHKPLYTQILHLMNKMSLDAPFQEDENAIQFFKEKFRELFVDEIAVIPQPQSETESELSSDECPQENKSMAQPALTKRKHTLPVTRKRPAAMLSMVSLPKIKKTSTNQEEVFENVSPVPEPKKISVVVPQTVLQKPIEDSLVVGELGKFEKVEKPVEVIEKSTEPEQPVITKRELLRNRISYRDMKILPVFKNYHPGQPSMRLYIKNLSKSVTEQDVNRIYKRYIENLADDEQIGFDVRVMQEGRMKGQAFVTFPSIQIAEAALNETNGYMLKEKPMVVQFARVANKKTIQ